MFKKILFFFLEPWLGDDEKLSIKRLLAVFFSILIYQVIHMPWNPYTVPILIVLTVGIGIWIGIATFQTLQYLYNPKITQENKDNNS